MSQSESGRPARNRLGGETSPYLLQHAANPVDWYPWGDEAFERARREDRPVLLSVGYSACHWCHVMERESFEDEETARLMNEHFVSVKVDREERPDVDALYMAAVQQMTGHGGWPMTVFLTPEGVPFYGGTYFPPRPRPGMPSFRQVLSALADAYRERRDEVLRSADRAREVLQRAMAMRAPTTPLDSSILDGAADRVLGGYDERNGGFGSAPKFPQPMVLEFLLRTAHRTGDERALAAVEGTLEAMARGGIFDHLGGGFHRYSVDARWLVPHFEKMLYDNALLARVYLHAHLATGREDFRRTAGTVLDYVLREMTSPEGAFYSTEDADSEGEEGRFYLWTAGEVDDLLGPVDGPLFRRYYDVTPAGNFAGDGHEGQEAPAGASILHAPRDVESVAADAGVDAARLEAVLERGRRALLDARAARVRPARDEKVLTAWNAMMARTLAEAGAALSREDYLAAARRCADYLLRVHRPDGVLLRTSRDGRARIGAFLEDHALLADALVSLYEADFDPRWIEEARAVAGLMLERHWSEPEAMFHDTASDGEALVVRPRDVNDGATPSGVSSAVTVLLRLAALTGEDAYERIAVREMENLAGLLPEIPHAFGELLCAVDAYVRGTREVAVVGRPEAADTLALLRVLRGRYLPATVLALRDPGADDRAARAVPLLRDREMVEGRAAAYVCRRFTCRRPVTEPEALEAELSGA